jgi:hypothetical protein
VGVRKYGRIANKTDEDDEGPPLQAADGPVALQVAAPKTESDLQPQRERIRNVRQGPDGGLYLLTDNASVRILKLVPKEALGKGPCPRR